MLQEMYINARLSELNNQRARPEVAHEFELNRLQRRNSLPRRLARRVGRMLLSLAEQLSAYGADRPRGRLTLPDPPVVELRPFSNN